MTHQPTPAPLRQALLESNLTPLTGWPMQRGKVRDIYDLGNRLLLVATDRLSAFDWVLPTGIPDRGRILTQLSNFWFDYLGQKEQVVATEIAEILHQIPQGDRVDSLGRDLLAGRAVLVNKTKVAPVECVVRGYLAGSGWKEYQQTGEVCGVALPPGLLQSDRLPKPIFTPATKATSGHDQNISFQQMVRLVGEETAEQLRMRSLELYRRGADHALKCGLLLADTKFEWGEFQGRWILVDEALTPDSSRYWPADQYTAGSSPPSFDKQFVRDWLLASGWDQQSPPPVLPDEIVRQTRQRYLQAFEQLTGRLFPWASLSQTTDIRDAADPNVRNC